MAHKQILFRSAAREKILRGATLLADAVRVTLGPKSKSVLIQKSWGAPIVRNDGMTIAKEFDLKDPEETLGAQVLRQAAERTGDVVHLCSGIVLGNPDEHSNSPYSIGLLCTSHDRPWSGTTYQTDELPSPHASSRASECGSVTVGTQHLKGVLGQSDEICWGLPMSLVGQSLPNSAFRVSGPPRTTDMVRPARLVPIRAKPEVADLISITSPARPRSATGISIPNAFAVLRLMTSSAVINCCTGN